MSLQGTQRFIADDALYVNIIKQTKKQTIFDVRVQYQESKRLIRRPLCEYAGIWRCRSFFLDQAKKNQAIAQEIGDACMVLPSQPAPAETAVSAAVPKPQAISNKPPASPSATQLASTRKYNKRPQPVVANAGSTSSSSGGSISATTSSSSSSLSNSGSSSSSSPLITTVTATWSKKNPPFAIFDAHLIGGAAPRRERASTQNSDSSSSSRLNSVGTVQSKWVPVLLHNVMNRGPLLEKGSNMPRKVK